MSTSVNQRLSRAFERFVPLIVLYSIVNAIGEMGFFIPEFFSGFAVVLYLTLVPVLSALILWEWLGVKGILYGIIVGSLSTYLELGLIGGIVVAFLVVGFIHFLKRPQFVPKKWDSFMEVSAVIITMILLYFVIAWPIRWGTESLFELLESIRGSNVILLVTVLGAMTAADLGGPINKVAYVFTLQAYTNGLYIISGSVLLSVGIAPLAIAVTTYMFPRWLPKEHQPLRRRTLLYGLFGITEGALPHAALSPKRILPAAVLGSATAACLGGVFSLSNNALLPTVFGVFTTRHIPYYLLAHLIGIVVAMLYLYLTHFKREESSTHYKKLKKEG